jgi:hypothetical protein
VRINLSGKGVGKMKLTKLNTLPVKSLKEVFNSSYTLITIVLKNNARIELTQSRRSGTVCLAQLWAKINGVKATIILENGEDLIRWYEQDLQVKHTVDYSDPVKEASLELYESMKEWVV